MTGRDDACKAIEDAIRTVGEYAADNDEIITDGVLLLGLQRIDDDGDRGGRVLVFPRHGSQPPYITLGLIQSAQNLVANAQAGEDE